MNILLLPWMEIINANALSSPYTIGFPAMTALLGGVHALQRKLNTIEDYEGIKFKSVGVVSHEADLQTFKGKGDFDYSIIGTGNPLNKDGERSSFIEEARIHLKVSLIIEFEDTAMTPFAEFTKKVKQILIGGFRLAGGNIINLKEPQHIPVNEEFDFRSLTSKLMPGFCLIERRDLITNYEDNNKDVLDSILDYLKVNYKSELDDKRNVKWESSKKEKGWIVPIATGFQAITDVCEVKNQRDYETPHRFAESIITLGEFIMPYRLKEVDEMLWKYNVVNEDLYICEQKKSI